MFKRIFRVSECVDACIYTKRAEEKINEVNKVSKLCFGAPEMFSASQNYLSVSYHPKSGGFDVFILQVLSLYVQALCSE